VVLKTLLSTPLWITDCGVTAAARMQ